MTPDVPSAQLLRLAAINAGVASRRLVVGVIGLGYVGVAVGAALAEAGFHVVGVDLASARVDAINAGACPIVGDEPELPELVAKVAASKHFVASTDYAPLAEADVVLIAVETPVESNHRPRFEALLRACASLGGVMKRGALVIVESTVSPGTTEKIVGPALEAASAAAGVPGGAKALADGGFFLGHCPQRVMPGRLLANLRTLARVCGGATPETARAMATLYATVVSSRLDETDLVTAELVKTAENTYRDVKIAFANELGMICEAAGADFSRVRELVSRSTAHEVLFAGAGVGGHCIPKDPWLLAHGVTGANGVETPLLVAARAVNDGMPRHMVRLLEDALTHAGTSPPSGSTSGLGGARILVLGYAYLENTGDARNSPSAAFVALLRERGAEVAIHDPWVTEHGGDLWDRANGADAAVLMVAHDAYRAIDLTRLASALRRAVLVDGRHVFEPAAARAAGLVFRGLGRPSHAPDR